MASAVRTWRRTSARLGILFGGAGLVAGLVAAAAPDGAGAASGYAVTRTILQPAGAIAEMAAMDPANGSVYVGGGGRLWALDAATGAVTATVGTGNFLGGVAADPATDRIYAAGQVQGGTGTVAVLDGATNTMMTTISLAPYASGPAAVDTATNTIYVTDYLRQSVTVINGATNEVSARIQLTAPPYAIAVDPATDKVYVTEISNNAVAVIDGATNSVSAVIPTFPGGRAPSSVAVNQVTNTIYVVNFHESVSVINGATNTVTRTITVSAASNVGVDSASNTIYVATDHRQPNTTAVIDGSSGAVVNTIGRGGTAVAVDETTGTVFEPIPAYRGVWVITPNAVNQTCPVLTDRSPGAFAVGLNGSYRLQADALPAATFSETGALPAGVSLGPDGLLAGKPAPGTTGTYTFMVTVSNGIAPPDTEAVTLLVDQPPAVTSAGRATFTAGATATFTVVATGVPAPSLSDTGKLPAGLTLSPSGALSGTPAAGSGGIYPLTMTAANAVGQVSQAFTLTVQQAASFTSPARVTFRPGRRNSFTIRSTGFPAARLTMRGHLPRGLTFRAHSDGTATLSGIPKRSATGHDFVIVITATNGTGTAARQTFTLRIR